MPREEVSNHVNTTSSLDETIGTHDVDRIEVIKSGSCADVQVRWCLGRLLGHTDYRVQVFLALGNGEIPPSNGGISQ